jgi:two-component system chemotaxis response regulator CheY
LVKVIIIDDDKDTVDVLSEYLELIGIQVAGKGYNGKDAVDLYIQHTPDVVFVDLMMPEYDGFYALENIRNIEPSSKVIVVTADIRADTSYRLDRLKPTEVFMKPYDLDKLSKFLKNLS